MEAGTATNPAVQSETCGIDSRRRNPFASFVILDIEATGLKRKTRITELCMLSVLTDELKSGRSVPRVINKLQLCFNPQSVINVEASRITGLYNDALEQMPPFKEQASLIIRFLANQPQPTCLIAHNGLHFDFKLFQAELSIAKHSLPDDVEIWCADSLHAFRVLDGLPARPEWVVQKEIAEKTKQSNVSGDGLNCNKEAGSTEEVSPEKNGTSITNLKAPGGTFSGNTSLSTKRCADSVSGPSELKVPKLNSAATQGFDSQGSLTDAEIAEAYDVILAEVSASVTPRQSDLETTPPSHSKQGFCVGGSKTVAEQFLKKHQPPPVDAAEKQRVARRLFTDETASTCTSEAKNGEHEAEPAAAVLNGSRNRCSLQGEQAPDTCNNSRQQEGMCAASLTPSAPLESKITSLTSGVSGAANPTADDQTATFPAQRVSYRLGEIYKREFGHYPYSSHAAEDDCITLLKLIVKKTPQFITYVEGNAISLRFVDPIYDNF